MTTKKKPSSLDLEWERRVLCSDESCIGIIGTDGCCKECGRRYEGELPSALVQEDQDVDSNAQSSQPHTDRAAPDAEDNVSAEPEDEWERRTLCSDESCIGVIGSDGRCKECGKPYQG